MSNFIKTAAFAIAALLSTGLASPVEARQAHMPTTGITSQPIGHYEFCQRYSERCQRQQRTGPVQINDQLWNKIVEVNSAVNATIVPRTDQEMHGQPDVWSYPSTYGDCEDYALLKQYMLERAGIPTSALLVTVVLQSNGEGHAVLTVRTDRGDLILDNLATRVSLWNETEYTYLKRQSDSHAGQWVDIMDDRNVLVGSLR